MLPLMAVIPSHENPIGKQDCVDTWRRHGRMCVPTRGNHIIDLLIVAIYETTAVNGLPLDLLIEAQTAENDPIKQFGVIFSKNPPNWSQYGIPILWRQEGIDGVGRWR